MKFGRGLQGEHKGTDYSIKSIRCSSDVQYYSVPPDKTRRERYQRASLLIWKDGRNAGAGITMQ